jgi:hypothetical protein
MGSQKRRSFRLDTFPSAASKIHELIALMLAARELAFAGTNLT